MKKSTDYIEDKKMRLQYIRTLGYECAILRNKCSIKNLEKVQKNVGTVAEYQKCQENSLMFTEYHLGGQRGAGQLLVGSEPGALSGEEAVGS